MTSLLEENNLVGLSYAEPYAGGSGLALRLLMEGYVSEIFINDLDPSIFSFWYAVLNNPDEMCRWLETVRVDVENWTYFKGIQRDCKKVDPLDLAKSTLFLNRTNVSGVISGGPIGGQSQKGKYKIDVRFNRNELIRRIEEIAYFANRVHLSNLDGIDFLDEIEFYQKDSFIYLDPPYYQKGAVLYLNAFNDSDHKSLASRVKLLHNLWMVSYDNHTFISELYGNYHKIRYKLSQCASNRVGDEMLIFDDRLKYSGSIKKLKSPIEQ